MPRLAEANMRWRLFEQKGDKLFTLFHGIHGNRKVEEGVWYYADEKPVSDGSSSKTYLGGFHTFYGMAPHEIEAYIGRFTKPRHLVLVNVCVGGWKRRKPTNRKILLASRMLVPLNAERITVKEAV